MTTTKVLSGAALCLLATACADSIPVEPTSGLRSASAVASAKTTDEQVSVVSPSLAQLATRLGLAAGPTAIVSAELIYDVAALKEKTPTLILANDRVRGTGVRWVPGDPRRGGRRGVNWSIVQFGGLPSQMYTSGNPALPTSYRPATVAEALNPIIEGMSDWANESCMRVPVEQTGINNLEADILHGLWMPGEFIAENWGPSVLGITLSSAFVHTPGQQDWTDIDGDGNLDYAQAIILYNDGKKWSNNGPLSTVDLYSVITHEAGHAFGLNHFGKVFVNGKNIQPDGSIFVDDIKYAPKALMNAVYIMGRGEIRGTDHSSFCQIWSSVR